MKRYFFLSKGYITDFVEYLSLPPPPLPNLGNLATMEITSYRWEKECSSKNKFVIPYQE